jgi:hypothetical protein
MKWIGDVKEGRKSLFSSLILLIRHSIMIIHLKPRLLRGAPRELHPRGQSGQYSIVGQLISPHPEELPEARFNHIMLHDHNHAA